MDSRAALSDLRVEAREKPEKWDTDDRFEIIQGNNDDLQNLRNLQNVEGMEFVVCAIFP